MIAWVLLLSIAAPLEEAKVEARERVEHGNTCFEAGQYREAIAAYEEALELYPSPRILVNLAEAQREAGLWGSAQLNFQKFLEQGGAKPGTRIYQSLTARIREIDALAARLAITEFADELELTIDGMPVGDPLEEPILLAPGRHELIARAPGLETKALTVILEAGAVLRLSLALEEKPAPVAIAPPPVKIMKVIEAPRELLITHRAPPFMEPAGDTPVIESWWFWTIIGVVVAGAAAGTVALHNSVADVPEPSELGASRFSTWEGQR